MDLVTVTCLRDYKDMIRQAQSIHLYLEPCTHWVVVNDEFVDEQFWKDSLTLYYKNHNLKLLFPKWKEWAFNFIERKIFKPRHPYGYKNQQVYKLLISENINNDYLIIDSDTFFINNCSIEEWKNMIGSGRTMPIDSVPIDMQNTIKLYADKIDCDIPNYVFDCCVHFMIHHEVMKNVKNLRKTLKWFNRQSCLQSEFYFYNLLAYKQGKFDGNSLLTDTKSRLYYDRSLSTFNDHPSLKAILFKQQYFDDDEKNRINDFLLSKGISVTF